MPSTQGDSSEFIDILGRTMHYRCLGDRYSGSPMVFLHEGLGSVELWRDFPARIVEGSRHPGLIYSRHGNGWSEMLTVPRRPSYMHEEALQVLPEVVGRLLGRPPILVGHSDGASIALIYAGSGHPVEGLVLLAPHVFVEPETVASIASVRDRFPDSDIGQRMAKYHADPESTFRGWADIWLSRGFRSWNIQEYLSGVHCPTLLLQGDADEYGTTRQLDAIERAIQAPAQRLIVGGAGHSPHLSHPEVVTDAVVGFIDGLG